MNLPKCPGTQLVNNDVHAWTPIARRYLIELKEKLNLDFSKEIGRQDMIEFIAVIIQKYKDKPQHKAVIDKMVSRTITGGGGSMYEDPDLDVNIWILFDIGFDLAKSNGSIEEFSETLLEMNGHCPQGDSHRLLMFIQSQL